MLMYLSFLLAIVDILNVQLLIGFLLLTYNVKIVHDKNKEIKVLVIL